MNQPATIPPYPLHKVEKEAPVKIMIRTEDKILLDLLATIFINKILQP